jgi:hypothetical protein
MNNETKLDSSWEDEDGMEMPTPCQKCKRTFDLNDGYGSEKWFPGTVICKSCYNEEAEEIAEDEEIEELKYQISDAEFTIRDSGSRLKLLGEEYFSHEEKFKSQAIKALEESWKAMPMRTDYDKGIMQGLEMAISIIEDLKAPEGGEKE